jgi:two-component system nitrogen regulation response regulator NtrX
MKTILVVDDERDIREALEGVLTDEGYNVVVAANAEEALTELFKNPSDLVILDIWMPGMDGVDALKEIKAKFPNLPVIMISGHGTIETAVKTTKLGAYDFIEKPLSLDKAVLTVGHALEQKRLLEENIALRQGAEKNYEIIGNSKVIGKLKEDITKVAPTNSWVLITGENGTGKEIAARNIHLFSARASKPFVAVNCAAIPEELIESELFGHEKGAFTGAVSKKKGKFDMADGGTLFLDEIGDMSLKTQAKVLRILQGQSFERVGGTEKISVDVRVIAATNKDLEEEMKKGNFREDLYYRLNVIPFHIPPLRERAEDIPLFVDYYFKEFSLDTGREVPHVDDEALKALLKYDWPGNVREIKNLVERLVIMTTAGVIKIDDLPPYFKDSHPAHKQSLFIGTLKEARKDFEREFILKKLNEFGGNMAKTAESIGIERSHLYRKVKSYGIKL